MMRRMLNGVATEIRRWRRQLWLKLMVALMAAMGLVMLMVSLFYTLQESMTPPVAAGVIGGALLGIAGLIAVVAPLLDRNRSDRPVRGEAPREPVDALALAVAAIGRDIRSDIPVLALAALVSGCVLGSSPELRRVLVDRLLKTGKEAG